MLPLFLSAVYAVGKKYDYQVFKIKVVKIKFAKAGGFAPVSWTKSSFGNYVSPN